MSLHRFLALTALPLATTFALSGCDFDLFDFEDGGGLINVHTTHHASPEDGRFPERPAPDRIEFTNDEGWDVLVSEALVATAGVHLEACDGAQHEVSMYFGTVPESLLERDCDLKGLGGSFMPPGRYCGATVTYAPYAAHENPDGYDNPVEAADGTTVFLKGVARKGEQEVFFELSTDAVFDVTVDLDRPLEIYSDHIGHEDVTLSKSYDRFFDGVDFNEIDSLDADALLPSVLEFETRVSAGITPNPMP